MYYDYIFFFFNDTATTEIYTLSLHDALPISRPHADRSARRAGERSHAGGRGSGASPPVGARVPLGGAPDGDADRVPGGGRVTPMPRKVAVIGAGDIGCGWAALCASAGWPVTVFDASAQGLERAAAEVPRRTRALVALERATQGIVERGLLEFTQARSLLQAVQDADWVIEAIPEDAIAKQKLSSSIALSHLAPRSAGRRRARI